MKTTINNPNLHNPHLDGDFFFWQAGSTGIFLSHGYSATTAEIRLVAEKFHGAGYTVGAPLLPGHGTHPKDLNQVKWQDWADAGKKELGKLFKICDQVWVAGESMGGVLALHLASQYPKVQGVILYAPAIRLAMSFADKLKLHLGSYLVSEAPRDSLDVSDLWQGYPGIPLKGAVQLLRFQKAVEKELSKINQPTLVFQGRNDMTVAPEAGELILQNISSEIKEHHWMENSSHAIVIDKEYEKVAKTSLEFIAKYGA